MASADTPLWLEIKTEYIDANLDKVIQYLSKGSAMSGDSFYQETVKLLSRRIRELIDSMAESKICEDNTGTADGKIVNLRLLGAYLLIQESWTDSLTHEAFFYFIKTLVEILPDEYTESLTETAINCLLCDTVTNPGFGFIAMSVCILTAGTMILVWLGERITEHGIGNGVSIIITINIIERLPQALVGLYEMMISGATAGGGRFRPVHLLILLMLFAVVTALTVILNQGQRRIPIQMAKKIVGSKMTGGSTYIPLKVNFSGVMPIIFAGAILIFPPVLFQMIPNETVRSFAVYFGHETYSYMTIYGLLILAFSYFWVANMFNPVQIADNLKKEGAYIPGIRPGKPTADFLDSTMTKVTFAGAVFLTALAVFPMLLTKWLKIPYQVSSFFGGTSLLIIVGVTIDTLSQMESHLVMRNYDGFLQRGRIKSRRG